ncbi:hypothetical protein FQA39_LY12742 [Lamprigera yunnana]|nr:hypothetical protein FQA39_LY12742 [Lamprigera yunnana]
MHKLLVLCLCFKLAEFSLKINSEKEVVKEYVLQIIKNVISADATVFYVYHITNKYLPKEIVNPKITIDVTKKILNSHVYKTYSELVILDIRYLFLLYKYLPLLDENGLIDPRALPRRKYLIIVPGLNVELVKEMFYIHFHSDAIDLIILTFNSSSVSDTIRVYTSDPHVAENQCGKVVRAVQSYKYDKIKTIKNPGLLDKYQNCIVTRLMSPGEEVDEYKLKLKGHYWYNFIMEIISETLNVTIKRVPASTTLIKDQRLLVSPSEGKREEFRKYLEKTGVIDALTKVLVSLYEEVEKPENAVEYICNKLASQVCGETLTEIQANLQESLCKIAALECENATLKAAAATTAAADTEMSETEQPEEEVPKEEASSPAAVE